jgi:hypothetical protein
MMMMNNVDVKSARIRRGTPKSPQQIQEEQQAATNAAINSFFYKQNEDSSDYDDEEVKEQNQDGKQPNQWTNPKVRGRHKPTRKSDTQEEQDEQVTWVEVKEEEKPSSTSDPLKKN